MPSWRALLGRGSIGRRLATGGMLVLAVVLAVTGIAHAVSGDVEAGVVVDADETTVLSVTPGSPAWQAGIRPGQAVIELNPGEQPRDWVVITDDGRLRHILRHEAMLERLRDVPFYAALALLLLAAAVVVFRSRLAVAALLSVLAVVLASTGLAQTGPGVAATTGLAVATAAPGLWLAIWSDSKSVGRSMLVLAVAVTAWWLVDRTAIPEMYDLADQARWAMTSGSLAVAFVLVLDLRQVRRRIYVPDLRRTADLAAIILVTAVASLLVLLVGVPVPVVIALVLVSLLGYPRLRSRVLSWLDQVLLADVRDEAGIHAIEGERARVSREIHDESLQEIAGLIHRLDLQGGPSEEATTLRRVAQHLRRITTGLRPPELDDLGLAAAIARISQRPDGETAEVTVHLDPAIALPGDPRPPPEVELAVFRIVQEAITNSLKHSEARTISVTGVARSARLDVTVRDDGCGITADRERGARARGGLGLISMRQRAALIGAHFEIEDGRPGTVVRVRWDATG